MAKKRSREPSEAQDVIQR